jgi:putative endonuclease
MSEVSAPDWYLYVLRCADGSFYAGITTDPKRRLDEHNTSARGARYTRARRPVELIKSWRVPDRSTATKREMAFKRLSRDQKIAVLKGLRSLDRQ